MTGADIGRRRALAVMAIGGVGTALAPASAGASASAPMVAVDDRHETYMRAALAEGARNPRYPFGAVVVSDATGEVVARGVNDSAADPTLHGEIAAVRDYVRHHGNVGWEQMALYSTAEPCPMCMGALVWARMGQVIWGSSIRTLRRTGIDQIMLGAEEVARRAASFHRPSLLLGGVLAGETDASFEAARELRERQDGPAPSPLRAPEHAR